MAKTYPKKPLVVSAPSDAYEGYVVSSVPEAASQTFPVGSPIAFVSGYGSVFVAPNTAKLMGIAITAGNNGSAGANEIKYVKVTPEMRLFASFLGAAAIDNVLAATDLGLSRDLASDANLLGTGLAGWYVKDAADDASVIIDSFKADHVFSDVLDSVAAAGDTNARVALRVAGGASIYF